MRSTSPDPASRSDSSRRNAKGDREVASLHRVVEAALRADSLEALYATALEALAQSIGVDRAAILLLGDDGRMHFKAWIGISERYRLAVDGHSPWGPGTLDPRPIVIDEATSDPGTSPFRKALEEERIHSIAFIPLLDQRHLVGKLMLYSEDPGGFGPDEIHLASVLAGTVALALVRRRQEEELRDRSIRLDAMFKALPLMIYEAETGTPYRATWLSDNTRALTGFPAEPLLHEAGFWWNRVHPEDQPRVRAAFAGATLGRAIEVEYRWRVADGSYRWFLERSEPVRELPNGHLHLVGVWLDITERRQAIEALHQSEASYRGLFDCVGEAIYIQDREGNFLDVNPGACRMYGYSREELIGQSPALVSAPGRNDLPKVLACAQAAFEGEPQSFEFWGMRKNGEVFPKEVRLYPGTYFGNQVIIAVAQDISERRRAEEALRQSQKLESLGLLAGGIAHDFNNLLTAILGNLDLAQLRLDPSSPAWAYLQNAGRTVEKASDLTKQMLAYSGRGRFVVSSLDLSVIVGDMVQLLKVSISKKAHLDLDLGEGLPPIEADLAQLQQVVMNLVTNASDALEDHEGQIRVRTWSENLDPERLAGLLPDQGLSPGTFVVLEVADTGCGMRPEVASRIFDPFFTTKRSGRGLGLSAMQGILRGHRAGISLRSEPGSGSSFRLYFPVGTRALDAQAGAGDPQADRFAGRVLLVDDEDSILVSTGAMLESMGFQVLTAGDGRAALEMFQAQAADLKLVLMDLTMPRLDGHTAFLEMQRIHPGVPVLLSSGYDQKEIREGHGPKGLAGFIQKPYHLKELREVVRAALTPPS